MNWKEFLKPTVGKLILFLLIPVFYALYGFMPCPVTPFSGICVPEYEPLPLFLAIYSYATWSWQSNIILHLTIGVVLSYIFSCFIIWIYNKVKKK